MQHAIVTAWFEAVGVGVLVLGVVGVLLVIVLADAFSRRRDNLDDHRFD